MILRIAIVLCCAAEALAAPLTMRTISADGSADELTALVATVATPGAVSSVEPPELATAIAAFRAGDCASATLLVDAAARATGDLDAAHVRVELWRAGIAQRCERSEDAHVALRELLREHPGTVVDLGEYWPSLVRLADEVRAQTRPSSRHARALLAGRVATARAVGASVVVAGEAGSLRIALVRRTGVAWSPVTRDPQVAFAWLVAQLAPPSRTPLALDVELLGAGQESKHDRVAASWQGSGIGLRGALRPGRALLEVTSRVIAYPDAGNDPRAGGGWEWGLELRAGISGSLGRLAVSALALASADGHELEAAMMPYVGRTHLALGGAVRAEIRFTRALAGTAELGYAPIGHVSAIDAETPTEVSSRFAIAWRAGAAWDLEAAFAQETLRFQERTDLHEENAMRIALALRYRR